MINKELLGLGCHTKIQHTIQGKLNLYILLYVNHIINMSYLQKNIFLQKLFHLYQLKISKIISVSRFVFGIVRNILIDCLTINDNFFFLLFFVYFFLYFLILQSALQ